MGYNVKILCDSVAPNGKRLTTWELTFPRFIHSEFMTHRLFSRNAASSRAIPIQKIIDQVKNDPAMPVRWGKNQSGMQAREELSENDPLFGNAKERAKGHWLRTRDSVIHHVANELVPLGLHKQIANRLLEPWMFITVIMSATELDGWFRLRAHPDAQPEIAWVATEMKNQYEAATPKQLVAGAWHRPLIDYDDLLGVSDWQFDPKRSESDAVALLRETVNKISVARCARVSYLRHSEKRDFAEDVKLHDGLLAAGHLSPFEHVAQSLTSSPDPIPWSGNFCGWRQYRELVDPNFVKVGR